MSKKTAAAPKTSTPTPGGLVFERLGKDFVLPTISKQSMFEGPLKELEKAKGEPVALYKCPYENVRKAYTKAKAIKKQAGVMGIEGLSVWVRKMRDEAVVIVGIDLPTEE